MLRCNTVRLFRGFPTPKIKDLEYQLIFSEKDDFASNHLINVHSDGKFVGMVAYDPFGAELIDCWVHPLYRKQKIGSQLFDHFLAVLERNRKAWFHYHGHLPLSRAKQDELGIFLHYKPNDLVLGYLNPYKRHHLIKEFRSDLFEQPDPNIRKATLLPGV